jgi:NAD(P)-dependent dehydrogenase (short-subunit alcohol dehydrogenase family)
MKFDYSGRVALITGAGGGIGRAIAEKLAAEQMKLILLGGNHIEKLNETAAIVNQQSSCIVMPGDLTSPEFIAESIQKIENFTGGIDVLINNAGVAQNTPFENISLEEFDKIMAINVRVPFMLTQKALPMLKKSETPTIINIASVVSHAGYPMQSIYSASKHALLGMTKSIAREYYKENIRVHAICPGGVYTDMVKVSRPDLSPDGMIMPQDIADLVWFFLAHRTNAVVDEILVHRVTKEPFC